MHLVEHLSKMVSYRHCFVATTIRQTEIGYAFDAANWFVLGWTMMVRIDPGAVLAVKTVADANSEGGSDDEIRGNSTTQR